MENRHENRAQRGHDAHWDGNNTHKGHILNPKNTDYCQDYWRKVSQHGDHQAVEERLKGSLLLHVISVGPTRDKSIKDKGITYPNHSNGYCKWDYGPQGEKKFVKHKGNSGSNEGPNPDNDHHPNPGGHTLHVMVGDRMNHSEVTVHTATGRQQGSPPNVQGIDTIPACFHRPRPPDQVIQNSSWDEDQEDCIHDGDMQNEESVRREGGSFSVHLKQLPEDGSRGRKTQNKAEEDGNSPRVLSLGEMVT